MSDDPSIWWTHTTEVSMRLVLEYMPPQKPLAVLASSLSVRALGELKEVVEGKPLEKKRDAVAHVVDFVKYKNHSTYPVCRIDVHDATMVGRLLWWLQRAQPRAIQLHSVEKLSGDELQQVLDLLFTYTPVLPECVPLYTNLLEFSINASIGYVCTSALEKLGKCSSLRTLNLSWCKSLDHLDGLEKFPHLEELDISHTNIKGLAWQQNHGDLIHLHTIKLCSCKDIPTLSNAEWFPNLVHIDLSWSGVTNLAELEHCTSLRTVIGISCSKLRGAGELKGLRCLDTLVWCYSPIKDISFLNSAKFLKKLNINHTSVEDLTPTEL